LPLLALLLTYTCEWGDAIGAWWRSESDRFLYTTTTTTTLSFFFSMW
jgi:hypothetical protein